MNYLLKRGDYWEKRKVEEKEKRGDKGNFLNSDNG